MPHAHDKLYWNNNKHTPLSCTLARPLSRGLNWSYNCLVYFPLTLQLIHRSHSISDTLFQFFHPDFILCVIFASKSPFSANVAPRYLNVYTRSKCSPCILISEYSIYSNELLYSTHVNFNGNKCNLVIMSNALLHFECKYVPISDDNGECAYRRP